MNLKCCDKYKKPKITFSASPTDIVGLGVLLTIVLGMVGLLIFGVGASLVDNLSNGTVSNEIKECYEDRSGRMHGSGCLVNSSLFLYFAFFFAVWFILPKFLNACSYFIKYRLKIEAICSVCNKRDIVFDFPKTKNGS